MAVLLAKPESSHETVINLIRVVQCPRDGARLYRQLRRVVLHDRILGESWDALAEAADPVGRALHYFTASWAGRNGFAGTTNVANTQGIAVRWTPGGGHGGQRFSSAVSSIPAWRRRIRRVTVLQRDALPGVAVYCDPPVPR